MDKQRPMTKLEASGLLDEIMTALNNAGSKEAVEKLSLFRKEWFEQPSALEEIDQILGEYNEACKREHEAVKAKYPDKNPIQMRRWEKYSPGLIQDD